MDLSVLPSWLVIALAIFVGILFIVVLILYSVVLPIWGIVECVNSKTLGSRAKTIWILVIIIFWTVGAVLYGIFGSSQGGLKKVSIVGLILTILLSGAFAALLPKLRSFINTQMTIAINQIDVIETPGLKAEEKNAIKQHLYSLKEETEGAWFFNPQFRATFQLIKLFGLMTKDNKLLPEEYRDWMTKFEARNLTEGQKSE